MATSKMQKPNLTDYTRVVDDALPAEFCDQLVAEFERHAEQMMHRDTDLYQFDVINCNGTEGWEPVAEYVAQVAYNHASDYFDSLGLSVKPEIQGFEHVRLKRYELGQQFKEHVDVADYASARRYLICLFYLDDNDGGATTMDGLGLSVPCKKGRLFMFPPTWMYPHSGTPPIGKPKYTIATCLHYL